MSGREGLPKVAWRGRRDFTSTSMAARWDAGVVVGSGRVGAIVWGGPAEHWISLAHEQFFLPVNPRPLPPDLAHVRRAARRALLDGDPDAAARLVDGATCTDKDDLVWTDPLAPCGSLSIRVAGAGSAVMGYERHVDLERGAARLRWRSAADEVLVEVRSPRGTQRVEVVVHAPPGRTITARLAATAKAQNALQDVGSTPPASIQVRTSRQTPTCGALELEALGVVPGTGRRAITRVAAEGSGTVLENSPQVVCVRTTVPRSGLVRLTLDVEVVGPNGPSPSHVGLGDHGGLQRASWLDLGSGVDPAIPTELLHSTAPRDERARRALVELAYATGRYTVISATGVLPATLQGVWQGSWMPKWSSDYTLNGNLQNGGAASLIPTGTPELIRSLSRLLVDHVPDYQLNARRIFGFEGALLPSRMSTHGLANHFSHEYPHQFWAGAGGWILRMIADGVLATGDRSLVDDSVWTLAVEIMRFYRALAAEGWIAPGYSPENTPRHRSTPLSVQPTMDAAIIRDAPRAFRVLAEARRADVPECADFAVPAPGYRISSDGLLAEWQDPRFEDHLEHRHTSQLYALWYEPDGALDERLRVAARKLVRAKIAWRAGDTRPPPGRMEMAFGLAQLGLAAAALGDGEAALQCVEWLALLHVTVAMTSTHDAGEVFNVDASGALPALVASMLVQSTRRSIALLPAVPHGWRTGGAGGLTTRTGLVITELCWGVAGLRVVLRGGSESAWVRRDGVHVSLPARARMRVASGWSAPATVFDVGHPDDRELEFCWDPRRPGDDSPAAPVFASSTG